ncbi:MAG TPA: hypothetical protein VGW12_00215 [Pyrinomonadaceae bacterium]|nr:hypothetical protein [Pyrinomonadaceae bacterium]
MSRESTSEKAFETLLKWLNPDRKQAAERYEQIRRSLIQIFTWRGISDAEGLADETFERVTRRAPELAERYVGDPAMYFYSVAKNLIKEYQRNVKLHVPLKGQRMAAPPPADEDELKADELRSECLKRCLEALEPEKLDLVLSYYSKDKQAKIDHRKALAQRLGLETNALRVRMYRIRSKLESCIRSCLQARDSEKLS